MWGMSKNKMNSQTADCAQCERGDQTLAASLRGVGGNQFITCSWGISGKWG